MTTRRIAEVTVRSLIKEGSGWDAERLATAVKEGQRDALAQAITWVESSLPEHQERIEALLNKPLATQQACASASQASQGWKKHPHRAIWLGGCEERATKWPCLPLTHPHRGPKVHSSVTRPACSICRIPMSDLPLHLPRWVASREQLQKRFSSVKPRIRFDPCRNCRVGQSEVAVRSMVDILC